MGEQAFFVGGGVDPSSTQYSDYDTVTDSDDGPGIVSRLLTMVPAALALGAAIVASFMLTTHPLIGTLIACGMSVLGLAVDGVRYCTGRTVSWPKFLDASLTLLWAALAVPLLLLPTGKVRWVRLYAGLIIPGALAVVSAVSVLVGRPWVLQYAADRVGPEGRKSEVFRRVCAALSLYWAFLFVLMLAGNGVNIIWNTTLKDDNKTLTHSNNTINYVFGIGWGVVITIIGMRTGPLLAQCVRRRAGPPPFLPPAGLRSCMACGSILRPRQDGVPARFCGTCGRRQSDAMLD